ncbi:PREDICTED: agamous-like MADS-box protein AGL15 isoform X3 [Nelumbo nucifera]|uniref:Agamous-like MADS-box protein AGL15 isoform X3 n=1 Tax=Nelumbo nucifera TaxID=4432 RepID=A0A1U8BPP8_NELNU|nr:PREDICTED: agamous-like MADS-box protein AGL15 isoform X3 [Nelumbo nucifera]
MAMQGYRFQSFCHSGMKRTLSRYNKCLDCSETALVEYGAKKQQSKEVNILKDEIARLRMANRRMMGKELMGLSLKELQNLEHQLSEGILSVKDRKEQLLLEQLEKSRLQEQRALLENETLRKQVEELRGLLPSPECLMPPYLRLQPMEKKHFQIKQDVISSNMGCNCTFEKQGESDTSLHLGLPSDSCRKRKAHDTSCSNDSGTELPPS